MLPKARINGASVTGTGPQWCLSCHDEDDSWFGAGYPDVSNPTTDAAGYPVSGTWPGGATYLSAANPHSQLPETTITVEGGAELRRAPGDCLYCHAAHRGANAYDGLLDTFRPSSASSVASDQANGAYASACLACHGGSTPSGLTTAPVDIKRYITAETSSAGHRIKTSGGLLPVGAPLPCYECHNPHGSTRGNAALIADTRGRSLETSTDAGVRQFCFTCHTASDTNRGWDSVAGRLRAGGVVRPDRRSVANQRLPRPACPRRP